MWWVFIKSSSVSLDSKINVKWNLLYEKTTCLNQLKSITNDYLQMCKKFQLFTSLFMEIISIYKLIYKHKILLKLVLI
jgi:hypothetical protein